MTEQDLRRHILDIIHRVAPEADLSALGPEQDLRETLDIDSFDFLTIVIAINDKLQVNIPESDYRQVSTLAGIMQYLSHLTAASKGK
jgi:acyl carrier protein